MTTGNTKYGITLSGTKPSSDAKYTKSIDYLNLKADSLGSGISDEAVFNFGLALLDSIIGGVSLVEIQRKSEYPMYIGGE